MTAKEPNPLPKDFKRPDKAPKAPPPKPSTKQNNVVVWEGEPGYDIVKDIKQHGRICKRLSSCTCNRPEQGDKRDDCFDWVKV